jgi:hypothetical protein
MKIYIATYQVPFSPVVEQVAEFEASAAGDAAALAFINTARDAWWQHVRGTEAISQGEAEPFEPHEHLAYAMLQTQCWGGENHFNAMCDAADLAGINERFYAARYGERKNWPGYMRVAMGDDCTAEITEVHAYYGPRH